MVNIKVVAKPSARKQSRAAPRIISCPIPRFVVAARLGGLRAYAP